MSLNPRPSYNPATRRYRTPAGAPIDPAAVRAAVDATAQGAAERIAVLGGRLDSGAINLSQFMLDVRAAIKAAHLASMAAARGGLDRLGVRELGGLGSKLRSLYRGLDDLEVQYRAGTISAAMLAARMQGYARAAAGTYENAVRDREHAAGMTEERRIRHSSESCEPCREYAAMGWVAAGTLPAIGEACSCRGMCLCEFEYR